LLLINIITSFFSFCQCQIPVPNMNTIREFNLCSLTIDIYLVHRSDKIVIVTGTYTHLRNLVAWYAKAKKSRYFCIMSEWHRCKSNHHLQWTQFSRALNLWVLADNETRGRSENDTLRKCCWLTKVDRSTVFPWTAYRWTLNRWTFYINLYQYCYEKWQEISVSYYLWPWFDFENLKNIFLWRKCFLLTSCSSQMVHCTSNLTHRHLKGLSTRKFCDQSDVSMIINSKVITNNV
jgi:hypothetical protein